jgi:hypothetical protein
VARIEAKTLILYLDNDFVSQDQVPDVNMLVRVIAVAMAEGIRGSLAQRELDREDVPSRITSYAHDRFDYFQNKSELGLFVQLNDLRLGL